MNSQSKLEILCNNGSLYSEGFIERFGTTSPHWESDNWFQREASLRHDMVCLLLCNTEPNKLENDDNIIDSLEPPSKRAKVDEIISNIDSKSSSSGSSKTGQSSDINESDLKDIGQDDRYRYILLEGRSNLIVIQNRICSNYSYEKLTRQYDIFDRKEGKFIEVKVTKNLNMSIREFQSYFDDPKIISLFHIHPETMDVHYINKEDRLPGESKVISFLMRRLSEIQVSLGIQDSELDYENDLVKEVFRSDKFNKMMEEWVETFWKLRDLPLRNEDLNPDVTDKIQLITEKEVKMNIEDTTKREAEFIKFKGKLLPHVFTSSILTKETEDKEILNDLIKDMIFENQSNFNWFLEMWRQKNDTFDFLKCTDLKKAPEELIMHLGIGQKKSIRYDHEPNLKQKDFGEPPKLRYSAWISNLLKDSSEIDIYGLNYFPYLQKEEHETDHPMAKLCHQIVNIIFQTFCETELAAYCSKVRNFYSRIGGAYLKRGEGNSKRPSVVIFPLYSSGYIDEEKIRRVYGFVIRGPQHAKKATDRIPLITFELMGTSQRSLKYQQFIRKPIFLNDNYGRKWCIRVNSVMKHDAAYLTFVTNSVYLTANMIGEMVLTNSTLLKSSNFSEEVISFIKIHREWLLERVAESVYMAVMGNSQEEGTLAALRKIFMLKLNWFRGDRAYGADIKGFMESLNECLSDQPLALYFAKQFRDILEG